MSTSMDSWVRAYDEREDRRFERRIGTRVPVDGLHLRWRPAERRRRRRPLRPATVVDISVTGMTVVVTAVLDAGSVIELEHDGGRALAQVRWSMQPAGHHPRYGCVFVAVDKTFEAWIDAITRSRTPDRAPAEPSEHEDEDGADPARRRAKPYSPAVARGLNRS